jgi:putative ABC transport system permease protein
MFGVTAVVFAVGLNSTLSKAEEGQSLADTAPVQVFLSNGNPQPGSGPARTMVAAIRAEPGTLHYVASEQTELSAVGLTKQIQAQAFDGPSSWVGYELIKGHWFTGPDQVVVNTAYLTQAGLAVGDNTTLTAGGSRSVSARIVGEAFGPGSTPTLGTSSQTFTSLGVRPGINEYLVGLRPDVRTNSYVAALNSKLGQKYVATGPEGGQFYQIADSLIALLTLMMAVVAGLGVLNTVLLGTRDRVHDIGIFKAVGMTPRQTIAMVMCWVAAPAVAAAVIAVPVGMVLRSATANAMAQAAYTALPASFSTVYRPVEIVLLGVSGLAIAAAGALLPASWAAKARTATALRAE